jgi:hypothetical protein
MKMGRTAAPRTKPDDKLQLPEVLVEIDPLQGDASRRRAPASLAGKMRKAMADGDRWFEENFKIDNGQYRFYYLYALERYQSFREAVTGRTDSRHDWYDEGVRYLARTQDADGAWRLESLCGTEVDTAFATLFLMRSAKKSLQRARLAGGAMVGGRGLPTDLSNLELRGGKLVNPQLALSAEEALTDLEEGNIDVEGLLARSDRIKFSSDPIRRNEQLDRWRQVVLNAKGARRQLAVKALASARNLDNVPYLILALEDERKETVLQARDGLLFISRRLADDQLPDNYTQEQLTNAVLSWKEWYRSIQPDAQFLR